MKQISNKEYEKYQQYQTDKLHGRILTPDGLRIICAGLDNDLQRQMPKMTHATLSVQLKGLVEKGLVRRKQYETIPPVVEYSLTDIGMKFQPVLDAMKTWGIEYIDQMNKLSNT